MNQVDFFLKPATISQKQYEALRLYFVEGVPAKVVVEKFGYTHRGFTTIITQFNKNLKSDIQKIFSLLRKREAGKKLSISKVLTI
jgi:predicted DNA-binding protein (UPF0251 family)